MKRTLWMKKVMPATILAFFLSILIVSAGTALPTSIINQADPKTTVYLDPPTINGTVVGQEFNVSIMIRDSLEITAWQAGLIFDPALLNCTGFKEGEFLKSVAEERLPIPGTIDNTAGVITPYGWVILGEIYASGDGRLAYATFKVKAPSISDIHLRDAELTSWIRVDPFTVKEVTIPTNIIDVYTVVVDATAHTVVMVSNSTSVEPEYHSGFYDHSFNLTLKELSFKVTGPSAGFSNITIPKELLEPDPQHVWAFLVDGTPVSRTVTENTTHTSIYFKYSLGIHEIQATTRFMPSNISVALSSTSITTGDSATISGAIDPARSGVNVKIIHRLSGAEKWTSLANVTTNQNGNYTHTWTPETAGTYEVKASWDGDEETIGDESDVLTLTVKGAAGIDLYTVAAVVAAIIIIAAIVVYFIKFRRSKPE